MFRFVAAATAAVGSAYLLTAREPASASLLKPSDALSPEEFRKFTLQEKIPISHNTNLLRFKLEPGQKLGTFTASCLVTKAKIDDKDVIRPYTPTSTPTTTGHFDLVVKRYDEGKMSRYLNDMQPGEKVEMKGAFEKFRYKANMKKSIGMVAGGTGITPMLQVAQEILDNPTDKTNVTLVFANTSEKDILLKMRLDEMAKLHSNFKVVYVLDHADNNWKGEVGHVNKGMLGKYIPKPGKDSHVLVCGPPGFMKAVCGDKKSKSEQGPVTGILADLGFDESNVFKF